MRVLEHLLGTESNRVEADSMETVIDVAGEMLDDLKPMLPHFAESAKARIVGWNFFGVLRHAVPRGRAVREYDRRNELVREFGRE